MSEGSAPFRPILDRVLIKRIEPEAAPDGFEVPDKYRQHTNKGVIIAVGDGVVLGQNFVPFVEEQPHLGTDEEGKSKYYRTNFVRVGDTCLYGEYCAEQFEKDGETFYIVRVQDIRGVERADG